MQTDTSASPFSTRRAGGCARGARAARTLAARTLAARALLAAACSGCGATDDSGLYAADFGSRPGPGDEGGAASTSADATDADDRAPAPSPPTATSAAAPSTEPRAAPPLATAPGDSPTSSGASDDDPTTNDEADEDGDEAAAAEPNEAGDEPNEAGDEPDEPGDTDELGEPEGTAEEPSADPPEAVPCQPGPFGTPERVLGLDLGLDLWAPLLSADGRTLLFAAGNAQTSEKVFSAGRDSASGLTFLDAAIVAGVNSASGEGSPYPSLDGLRLYFYSTRANAAGGGRDIWEASRASVEQAFSELRPLNELNTPAEEHLPWLSEDELTILFTSTRPAPEAGFNLFQASRASVADPFGAAEPVANVNSDALEGRGALSRDALTLVLMSARAGGSGREDLWMARRDARDAAFGTPINLSEVNTGAAELDPALSADGLELLFSSDRGGRPELWRSTRACVP